MGIQVAAQGERERHHRTHNEILVLLPSCLIGECLIGKCLIAKCPIEESMAKQCLRYRVEEIGAWTLTEG